MVNVIDDFDSVMSQVMKELEAEEPKLAPELFNDVIEYNAKAKGLGNDPQKTADNLMERAGSPVQEEAALVEKPLKSQGPKTNGEGSFSIDLEGMIGVDLRLKFGDKELFLTCDGEQLIIRLGDGSSFNIPLKGNLEKAA